MLKNRYSASLTSCFVISFSFFINGCRTNQPQQQPVFAGSHTCIECHETEYHTWKGSDHDHAMDTAVASTVLGDFNNATFEHNGFTSRFYTKDGKYYVHTKGPQGVPGDFQIVYTFGGRPLQQYLIPFEKGRFQTLPLTWDTQRKVWYDITDSVYKGQEIKPDDWLYWTNNGQNWNGMCAECHSTNLRKNYNPVTHVYHTTWSEIDVSCEACHGPGSEHNKWAALSERARKRDTTYGLIVQTGNITSQQLVDQCAYCHARRTSFGDFIHPLKDIFDIMSPQLPVVPNYYPDGQIKEEDYVYGSFMQSKMHQNKVRCTNCHDPHSLKLKKQGNDLCLQCHKKENYDTYAHHHHKRFTGEGSPLVLDHGRKTVAVGEGSLCINCHMPGQYFMGVDFRRDHSMRIPRPDLSNELSTPNACTQCHTDKPASWAAAYTKKWYSNPTSRPNFGKTMHRADQGDTTAVPGLISLINSRQTANIVRAAATGYLINFPGTETDTLNRALLTDASSLVRREAVRNFSPHDLDDLIQSLFPLLGDSTKMVRLEATSRLAGVPRKNLDTLQKQLLSKNIDEYIATMNYSADFAASRHNLGNLYSNMGQFPEAVEQYREAIRIDNQFYPAKVNLAMLYNGLGENGKAEKLLKEVVKNHPGQSQTKYSLGLLLAEMKKYDEAVDYLQQAANEIPENPRVHYNLGQLLDFSGDTAGAEKALRHAVELDPENVQFLIALTQLYLREGKYKQAKPPALKIYKLNPNDPDARKLLDFINSKL